jgi:hypothetical protein
LWPAASNPSTHSGPGADSEEKREPVSDINTAVVDSLKVLTSNRRLEKRTFGWLDSAAGHEMPIECSADLSEVPIPTLGTERTCRTCQQ